MVTIDESMVFDPHQHLNRTVEFQNGADRESGIITQGYLDNGGMHFTIRTDSGNIRKFVPLWSIRMLEKKSTGEILLGFNDGETLRVCPEQSTEAVALAI